MKRVCLTDLSGGDSNKTGLLEGDPFLANKAVRKSPGLQDLYVFRLKPFGPLGDGEFHRLAFRQALEAAGLDRGEMHKHVSLTAVAGNKSKALGIVKPLHSSLFHCFLFLCYFDIPAEKD